MKKPKNTQQNQEQGQKNSDFVLVQKKEVSADPGEFRASALESSRSLEDGRDD